MKCRPEPTIADVVLIPPESELIWDIFYKIKDIPNMLVDEEHPGPFAAKALFDRSNMIFQVGDCGIIGVANIERGHSAEVHVTFWDGMLRGKEKVCRQVAEALINKFELKILYTRIPELRHSTLAFAKRVGFEEVRKYHGCIFLQFYLHGVNSPTGGI